MLCCAVLAGRGTGGYGVVGPGAAPDSTRDLMDARVLRIPVSMFWGRHRRRHVRCAATPSSSSWSRPRRCRAARGSCWGLLPRSPGAGSRRRRETMPRRRGCARVRWPPRAPRRPLRGLPRLPGRLGVPGAARCARCRTAFRSAVDSRAPRCPRRGAHLQTAHPDSCTRARRHVGRLAHQHARRCFPGPAPGDRPVDPDGRLPRQHTMCRPGQRYSVELGVDVGTPWY